MDGTRDELCWESNGNLNPSACGAREQFLADHSDKIADFVTWCPYSPNLLGSAQAVLRQGGSVPSQSRNAPPAGLLAAGRIGATQSSSQPPNVNILNEFNQCKLL